MKIRREVSTLIGMIIIIVAIIIFFGGAFAYQYFAMAKYQTKIKNLPASTATPIPTSTSVAIPISTSTTTVQNQIPQDSKHNSSHIEAIDYETVCGNIIWPAVRNIYDKNVLNKMEQVLGFMNIVGIIKQDNCMYLPGVDYQINYDKNNLLSISFFIFSRGGPYPSEAKINYVINLVNGEIVKLSDIFYQNKISDLVNFLNTKLQTNIQQQLDFARQQNPSGQGSQCSEQTVNQGLQSGKEYNPNYGKFTEQNLIASNNLNGETPQYASLKITSSGIEFTYDFGFAHAIQACEPNGVIVLTYDQLKDYIRLDGLLGNETK